MLYRWKPTRTAPARTDARMPARGQRVGRRPSIGSDDDRRITRRQIEFGPQTIGQPEAVRFDGGAVERRQPRQRQPRTRGRRTMRVTCRTGGRRPPASAAGRRSSTTAPRPAYQFAACGVIESRDPVAQRHPGRAPRREQPLVDRCGGDVDPAEIEPLPPHRLRHVDAPSRCRRRPTRRAGRRRRAPAVGRLHQARRHHVVVRLPSRSTLRASAR